MRLASTLRKGVTLGNFSPSIRPSIRLPCSWNESEATSAATLTSHSRYHSPSASSPSRSPLSSRRPVIIHYLRPPIPFCLVRGTNPNRPMPPRSLLARPTSRKLRSGSGPKLYFPIASVGRLPDQSRYLVRYSVDLFPLDYHSQHHLVLIRSVALLRE